MFADAFGVFLHIFCIHFVNVCTRDETDSCRVRARARHETEHKFYSSFRARAQNEFFIFSQIVKRDKKFLLEKQECSIDGM